MANIANIKTVLNGTEAVYPIKDATARAALDALAPKVNDLWNVGQSSVLYVSKRNSRFASINDAVEYAKTYCSLTNRVTIMISSGMYLEYIDLDNNPGIDFYGIGDVTIRSSVAWRLSTLRCSNAIVVYNINFENYYTPETGEHAGYALHADPVTAGQYYYNCSFYSNNNSSIGIGMGMNGAVNFYNCRFRSKNGAVYAHNNVTPGTTGQWLRFHRCHFETFDSSAIIRIDDAARLQSSSAVSTMGLVFIGCSGNNMGVVYRYNNPVETKTYIPTNSAQFPVFLYEASCLNEAPALNYRKQVLHPVYMFTAMGSATFYIPQPDAYKYNWSFYSLRYKDYNFETGTWGDWNTYTGAATVTVAEDQPEMFRVVMMGNQILAAGGRTFEMILDGVPKKDITFPVSFNNS